MTVAVLERKGGTGLGIPFDRETAIGAVGAAILIAAMAGVFFYERSQFDDHDVSWRQAEAGTASRSGSLEEGSSQSYTFTADADRLSTVRVSLAWSDDAGQPDTFEVAVQASSGTYTGGGEALSSPLEVSVPIHEAPETTTTTGRSIEEAQHRLNETATWTNGTGDWSVTVTLVSAPGQQIGGQETVSDGNQDYELTFTYERWEPSLAPN